MPSKERSEPSQPDQPPPAGGSVAEPRADAFRCGPWLVDPSLNRLEAGGEPQRLGSTAMNLLLHLVRRPGRLAAKEDLIREVWRGRAISDDALSVCVHELRKVLGDNARSPTYIETIPGKGYRWLPPVQWLPPDQRAPPTSPARPPAPESDGESRDGAHDSPGGETRLPPSGGDRHRSFGSARLWISLAMAATLVLAAVLAARRLAHGSAPAAIKTVAVLPLADFSPGASGDRVFADGLTETLIHALARHGPLRVISRTSTTRFAPPTDLSAPQIAAELGADLLVEGSVTREGDRVRIIAQLIDGVEDRHLWTRIYDAQLGDLLSLQARVAKEIAREIRLHAGGLEPLSAFHLDRHLDSSLDLTSAEPPRDRRSFKTAAIDAYFQGRAELYSGHYGSGGRAALRTALHAFEHAIQLEPDFAEAHSGLAKTQLTAHWQLRNADRAQVARRAGEAVARALELNPKLAMAHATKGDYLMMAERDLGAAERSFRLALGLDPSHLDTYLSYSWMLQAQRRFEETEALLEQARRVDPISPLPLYALAALTYNRGDDQAALAVTDRLDELLPGSARLLRAAALHNLGRADAAYRAYRRHNEAEGSDAEVLRRLDESFTGGGLEGYLRAALPLTQDPLSRAIAFMRLGDREAALGALTRAAADDDPRTFFAYASPILVPLHGEPRFQEVLRHYGIVVDGQRQTDPAESAPSGP